MIATDGTVDLMLPPPDGATGEVSAGTLGPGAGAVEEPLWLADALDDDEALDAFLAWLGEHPATAARAAKVASSTAMRAGLDAARPEQRALCAMIPPNHPPMNCSG